MRPPLAGKREAARRLAAQVRQRLEPVERALPVKLPGYAGPDAGPELPEAEREAPSQQAAEHAAARIDAARERLRASIDPPDEPEA